MKTVEQFAELHALGLVLSEWEGEYAEITENLRESMEIPEDLIVWQPFEDVDALDLADMLDDFKNDFLVFYSQVKGL